MSDYRKSVSAFLKTERGKKLLEELMDVIVTATVERIVAEDAQRDAWNRAGFTDAEIDRLALTARSLRGRISITRSGIGED